MNKEIFLELEKKLLQSKVRKSPSKISELLADDFVEFCSSGKKYYYKKGDAFEDPLFDCEIIDFEIKELSDDIILATYKSIKHSETIEEKKYALRSSLWKLYNNKWKMIFHQGTLTSK